MTNPESASTLKKPIAEWFENDGYEVKLEVRVPERIADVTAYKKDIAFVAIEIKESFEEIKIGISQCIEYSRGADKVYLAFPEYLLDDFNSRYDYKNISFGLIVVDDKGNVKLIKESNQMNPKNNIKEKSLKNFRESRLRTIESVHERFNVNKRDLEVPEIRRMTKKLTVECLWMYILGLLMVKPMHAYALKDEIKKEFGFTVGRITSYKVLYKLKRRGYVKEIKKKKTSGRGPERKYYAITEKGKNLLSRACDIMFDLTSPLTAI